MMAGSKERKRNTDAAGMEQLGRAGETIGGRTLPEVPDGKARNDAIEIWGRRIGRVLGWTAVALLLIQLVRIYGQ